MLHNKDNAFITAVGEPQFIDSMVSRKDKVCLDVEPDVLTSYI